MKDYFDRRPLKDMVSGATTTRPYKTYAATLTQAGTAAPVAVVLENQLSGPIVWARTGVGVYTGTLTAAFSVGKTVASITQPATGRAAIVLTSANVITVNAFNATPAAADDILAGLAI